MPKKTYFRSPNDDYVPGNNIQLGHVWRDPRDPGSFIGSPLPMKDMEINHNYKGSWTIDLGRNSHGKIGVWSKVAKLPITIDARTQWDKTEDGAYKVPKMDTYSIEPTPAYVKASVASVAAEILKSGDNLYMITGIKIARGGEGVNREAKNFGTDTQVGVDASAAGAQVEVGEQVSYSRGTHNNQEFFSTGDFVFAYRVREIFYKKAVFKTKEYNKGAVLGQDMIPAGSNEGGEPEILIEDAEINDDDVEVDEERCLFIDVDSEERIILI
jgi:hypothetical protein